MVALWRRLPMSLEKVFPVTPQELVENHGVTDPSVPSEDSYSATVRERDIAATNEAVRAYGESHPEGVKARRREEQLRAAGVPPAGPPAGSPEAYFEEIARGDG
jgi:hypothetical protein